MKVDPLKVVAEPRRQDILRLIWRDELSVGDLVEELELSYAGVSQHLARLLDAGYVRVRRDGKRRLYQADQVRLGPLAQVLESFWASRLDRLAELAENAEDA